MEDHVRGIEEPATTDAELSPKKRWRTDFLSQFLVRRREVEGSPDEDEDEGSEEKPKKFRRFFRRLFGGMVEKPELSGESSGLSERPSLMDALLARTMGSEASQRALEVEETEESSNQVEHSIDESSETPQATGSETPLPPEFADWAVLGSLEESQPEEHNASSSLQETLPPVVPEVTAPVQSEDTAPLPAEYRPVSEQPFPEPVRLEKETVVERRAETALPIALLGAEYLARKKADRKLRTEVAQRTDKLEENDKRNETATARLETLVRQNRERLETLKRERSHKTEVLTTPPPALEVDRQEQRPFVPSPEVSVSKKTVEQEVPPAIDKPEQQGSQRIMQEVAEAAEHNSPVERVFERSHEVKDDKTNPAGASAVGSIIANKQLQQPVSTTSHSPVSSRPSSTGDLPVIYDDPRKGLYAQAMRNGFWAAVLIIILGIIAYLLQ